MMTPLEEGSRGEGTFAKDGRGEREYREGGIMTSFSCLFAEEEEEGG